MLLKQSPEEQLSASPMARPGPQVRSNVVVRKGAYCLHWGLNYSSEMPHPWWPSGCSEAEAHSSLTEVAYLWGLCVFWESQLSWGELRIPFKESPIHLKKSVCVPSTLFVYCSTDSMMERTIPSQDHFLRHLSADNRSWSTSVSQCPGRGITTASPAMGWGRDGCSHLSWENPSALTGTKKDDQI